MEASRLTPEERNEIVGRRRGDWQLTQRLLDALTAAEARAEKAERERDTKWLCDCHTWPSPEEAHEYIVALEARIVELGGKLQDAEHALADECNLHELQKNVAASRQARIVELADQDYHRARLKAAEQNAERLAEALRTICEIGETRDVEVARAALAAYERKGEAEEPC
jgi:hypothetical protein